MQVSVRVHAQLRLATHVRACHCDGQVVLLDLRRNKYLGVGGPHLQALANAVEGWPRWPELETASADPVDIDSLTVQLLAQGLLTTQPAPRPISATHEEATCSLNADDASPRTALDGHRIYRFLASAASASLRLRFRSLHAIAIDVAARRAQRVQHAGPASPEALVDAVGVYQTLRPLIFTAHDRCLHDSLALAHFLAGEGLFAQWIIGVRTRPFGAHAWLQRGAVVLSDQHEYVRQFQPILVV